MIHYSISQHWHTGIMNEPANLLNFKNRCGLNNVIYPETMFNAGKELNKVIKKFINENKDEFNKRYGRYFSRWYYSKSVHKQDPIELLTICSIGGHWIVIDELINRR